jgi:hypothetical protein
VGEAEGEEMTIQDFLVIFGIFGAPTLSGAALGLWRYGWTIALGVAGLFLLTALYLLSTPPEAGELLGHVVVTNMSFLFAGEIAGGWALVALVRFWLRKRRT